MISANSAPETDPCNQAEAFTLQNETIQNNQRKTLWVIMLTAVTMVAEILAGWLTGSMALLADGWHMASHAGALMITYWVYQMTLSARFAQRFTFGPGKMLALGGYTSAIGLALVSILMAYESIERFMSPVQISYPQALFVAVVGLLVNLGSLLILRPSHEHSHDTHSDHHSHGTDRNLSGAIAHIMADALTSVAAIAALILGQTQGWNWADPAIGILGAAVILKWAASLAKDSAKELLDHTATEINSDELRSILAQTGAEVIDLHLWRTGPSQINAQIILTNSQQKGPEFYRTLILEKFTIHHLVIEERVN